MRRMIFAVMALAFLSAAALARSADMPILAVSDASGNLTGSIAHMTVAVRNGGGAIFIDSFPLAKVDTQMSTRFANLISCNFLDRDCSRYDFFYVIRAESSIIGGPSASAAAAALTVAVLDGKDIIPNASITGTINSGDIIGPVGGIKQKIEAAAGAKVRTVLIPEGEAVIDEQNKSLDLREYGKSLGVDVIEVGTLDEALFILAGKNYTEPHKDLIVDPAYKKIMRGLAETLCNRTKKMSGERDIYAGLHGLPSNSSFDRLADNLSRRGALAYEKGLYYSAASYCFGANVQLRTRINAVRNLTPDEAGHEAERISRELERFESNLDARRLSTITDLQAYMIVKERVLESRLALNDTSEDLRENRSFDYDLAYAEERLYSAYSWAHFFNNNGTVYDFGTDALRLSCIRKLSEADESYRYLQLYFPGLVSAARREYRQALDDYEKGNYALCLFRASKSKAHSSVILGAFGRDDESIQDLIDLKLRVVRDFIAGQATDEYFPIVGYSYYEYGQSLRDSDPYSSLLFLEYSLEIGNLGLYFDSGKHGFSYIIDRDNGLAFIAGFMAGVIFFYAILLVAYRLGKRKRKGKQKKKKRKKKGRRKGRESKPNKRVREK